MVQQVPVALVEPLAQVELAVQMAPMELLDRVALLEPTELMELLVQVAHQVLMVQQGPVERQGQAVPAVQAVQLP